MTHGRLQLHFRKDARLRFLGHRDLLRMIQRLFRRAQIPVAMSQGFHPIQKFRFVSALALGIESDDEVMEVTLLMPLQADDVVTRLNAETIDGLFFVRGENLDANAPKSSAKAFLYELPIPHPEESDFCERLAALQRAEIFWVEKANGKVVDLKKSLSALEKTDRGLIARFNVLDGPEAQIRELAIALGLEAELFRTIVPRRIRTILA